MQCSIFMSKYIYFCLPAIFDDSYIYNLVHEIVKANNVVVLFTWQQPSEQNNFVLFRCLPIQEKVPCLDFAFI